VAIRRARPEGGRRGFRSTWSGSARRGGPRERGLDPSLKSDVAAISAAATGHLARRDFASAELAARLEERGFDPAAIATVIAELLDDRILDDARFAENFVRSHARRGQGPIRIRQDLRALGLPDAIVQAALDAGGDWHALARSVRDAKFGEAVPADWTEHARQARFLQYRGFSTDHIRSALGRDPDP